MSKFDLSKVIASINEATTEKEDVFVSGKALQKAVKASEFCVIGEKSFIVDNCFLNTDEEGRKYIALCGKSPITAYIDENGVIQPSKSVLIWFDSIYHVLLAKGFVKSLRWLADSDDVKSLIGAKVSFCAEYAQKGIYQRKDNKAAQMELENDRIENYVCEVDTDSISEKLRYIETEYRRL